LPLKLYNNGVELSEKHIDAFPTSISYGLVCALARCMSRTHLLINGMVMTHPVHHVLNRDLVSDSCGGDICEDVL
jgi:hypothetical protein